MNWQLVIGEENDVCGAEMHQDLYHPGNIVYLPNHTLQIFYEHDGRKCVYEVDMDRQGRHIEWLDHLSHKTWATCDMIRALASAARRICTMTHNGDLSLWSAELADDACEHIENRDN